MALENAEYAALIVNIDRQRHRGLAFERQALAEVDPPAEVQKYVAQVRAMIAEQLAREESAVGAGPAAAEAIGATL